MVDGLARQVGEINKKIYGEGNYRTKKTFRWSLVSKINVRQPFQLFLIKYTKYGKFAWGFAISVISLHVVSTLVIVDIYICW